MSKPFSDYSVLVVGAGSIGRRHIGNLSALGVQHLAICDPQIDRLQLSHMKIDAKLFCDFEEALVAVHPDAVFVCTPPVFHVQQSLQAVNAGAHVFIEKPLSHSLKGIDELISASEQRQRVVQIGYNLRFHPGLQMVKQFLDAGVIGHVLWANIEMGQYLPDWRPWQDYRQSYTARKELGGGIILDASHELDYALWLMGEPSELTCMAGHTSDLDVDVEDSATILLRFPDGAQADVHMDFVQKGYTRRCKLAGSLGTIIWDYTDKKLEVYTSNKGSWEYFPYEFDANDMYLHEVEEFLSTIASTSTSVLNLHQAKRVLIIALAARDAAASRTWVSL